MMVLSSMACIAGDIATGISGTCTWVINESGVLTVRPTSGTSGTMDSWGEGDLEFSPWYEHRTQITSVKFEGTIDMATCNNMFNGCENLESIDLTGIKTDKVESMVRMFFNCGKLQSLDVSKLNTSSVTDMWYMFAGCSSLTSLDLSNFNTSEVEKMHSMFERCSSLTSLDLSSFSTRNVIDVRSMFERCTALTSITLGDFDMRKVGSYYDNMFDGCNNLTTLTLKSVPYLANGTFNTAFNGKTVNYALVDNFVYAADTHLPVAGNTNTCSYTRNYTSTNWQALYLPFAISYSDWAANFDVAAITNFHEYSDADGNILNVELEVRYVKKGSLLPNTPYLIRAKAAGERTVSASNATVSFVDAQTISCSSTERRYTFTGTYQPIDGLKTKDYIFVSGGRLCKAGNDTDVLKPMRWYLTIADYANLTNDPSPAALAKPMNIRVIGDNGDPTGIEDLTVVSSPAETAASGIYTVTGIRLAKPQHGINIVNGKKVVISR